jgi:hypothetical protein
MKCGSIDFIQSQKKYDNYIFDTRLYELFVKLSPWE